MNNNTVQNKIQKVEDKVKYLSLSRNLINPRRDWIILIIILSLFVILSIGFDIYMYKQITSGDMYVSINKDELTIERLKKNELSKIIDSYESKKTNINNLKVNNLVDPSL